jgi:hypothetical protein
MEVAAAAGAAPPSNPQRNKADADLPAAQLTSCLRGLCPQCPCAWYAGRAASGGGPQGRCTTPGPASVRLRPLGHSCPAWAAVGCGRGCGRGGRCSRRSWSSCSAASIPRRRVLLRAQAAHQGQVGGGCGLRPILGVALPAGGREVAEGRVGRHHQRRPLRFPGQRAVELHSGWHACHGLRQACPRESAGGLGSRGLNVGGPVGAESCFPGCLLPVTFWLSPIGCMPNSLHADPLSP